MSVSRFLKILSTIQNGTSLSFEFVQTRFPFRFSSLPSSIRGAWLVGPIKVLQISNLKGWCCQYVIKLRNKSGLLNNGLSSGFQLLVLHGFRHQFRYDDHRPWTYLF
jgi:hypothetical protein